MKSYCRRIFWEDRTTHDWAFITHDVIWRFEFLLVLGFVHNMLYFRRGILSLYTVDRRLGDRFAYATLFVFYLGMVTVTV